MGRIPPQTRPSSLPRPPARPPAPPPPPPVVVAGQLAGSAPGWVSPDQRPPFLPAGDQPPVRQHRHRLYPVVVTAQLGWVTGWAGSHHTRRRPRRWPPARPPVPPPPDRAVCVPQLDRGAPGSASSHASTRPLSPPLTTRQPRRHRLPPAVMAAQLGQGAPGSARPIPAPANLLLTINRSATPPPPAPTVLAAQLTGQGWTGPTRRHRGARPGPDRDSRRCRSPQRSCHWRVRLPASTAAARLAGLVQRRCGGRRL